MGSSELTLLFTLITSVLLSVIITEKGKVRSERSIRDALAFARTAKELANLSLTKTIDLQIAIESIQKSTHSIVPIRQDNLMEELVEKQLNKISGVSDEDFDTDLANLGFDPDPNTTDEELEDLV